MSAPAPARRTLAVLVSSLLFVFLSASLAARPALAAPIWTPPENVSQTAAGSYFPDAVFDSGGRWHIVWQEAADDSSEVYHRVWDHGAWLEKQTISDSRSPAKLPRLAADEQGLVTAAWFQEEEDGVFLYTSCWSQGGWGNSFKVIDEPIFDPRALQIATDAKGRVHYIWLAPDYSLRWQSSYKGSWSSVEAVSLEGSAVKSPYLSRSGDGVVALWREGAGVEGKIFSRFWGGGWGESATVGEAPANGQVTLPTAASSEDKLCLSWQSWDGSSVALKFRCSAAGEELTIGDFGLGLLAAVDLAFDGGGRLHLVCDSQTPYHGWEVKYVNFENGWGNSINLSQSEQRSSNPQLSLAPSGEVFVAWQESGEGLSGSSDIYYTQSFSARPVIFVHGLADKPSNWLYGDKNLYRQQLLSLGYPDEFLRAYEYPDIDSDSETDDTQGDIRETFAGLRDLVEELSERHRSLGGDGKVDIVSHSIGGILAREYLRSFRDDHRVRRLITIATPHQGVFPLTVDSFLSLFPGLGSLRASLGGWLSDFYQWLGLAGVDFASPALQQIGPYSDYLEDLNSDPVTDVGYDLVYGDLDFLVSAKIFFREVTSLEGSAGDGLVSVASAVGVPVDGVRKHGFSDDLFLNIRPEERELEEGFHLVIDAPLKVFDYSHKALPRQFEVAELVVGLLAD